MPAGSLEFRSTLTYVPELDAVVVVLYNYDAADPELALPGLLDAARPTLEAEG